MRSRNTFLILSIVFAVLALYVACTSFGISVALTSFGTVLQLPLGSILLMSYGCGLATIGTLWASQKRREIKGEQKMIKWANQDAKLMAEVASDKEKQLENKIATLEVALKTALKKKNELEEKTRGV